MRSAVDRDLVLGHRLEQRALRARWCAVDLVGEQHVREDRAGMEFEAPRLRVEHRHADDVRGQQVGGELHALEAQAQGRGQRVRKRGLAQARQVLDQQVAVGQQRDEGQPHFLRLAEHQRVDLGERALEQRSRGRRLACWRPRALRDMRTSRIASADIGNGACASRPPVTGCDQTVQGRVIDARPAACLKAHRMSVTRQRQRCGSKCGRGAGSSACGCC